MSLSVHRQNGSLRLIIRSLEPTSASFATSFIVGGCIIGSHLLLISLNDNVAPSALHDPSILQAYEKFIMGPLLRLTNSATLNNFIAIILWGLFGWFVYSVAALVVKQFNDWHQARRQIRIIEDNIISGSQERSLGMRLAWRSLIVVLTVGFTLLIMPWLHRCFADSYSLLKAQDGWFAGRLLVTDMGMWLVMLHGYIVLLRLYLFRTRILGEILY